ncbi:MAG TPA: hypothetical protein EYO58_08640 [Flavobacteriales bacterium]|nr:hypothetical protein [Flavobacteriales bacterium]HIO15920.1 hypothetical protein [Flavobacteriales bacterium]
MNVPSTLKSLVSIAFIWGISLNQNIAQAQPTSLPTAESVWPAGKAGVDYNLSDEAGEKDGVWVRVYGEGESKGELYYTGTFNHGTPEGIFLYFYESGKLMSKIEHPFHDSSANTLDQTSAIHYRENSSVQASGFYISTEGEENPVREGSWGFYDEGSKQRKMETYAAGKLDGPYWIKTAKGQLVEKGEYASGVLNGVKATYYDNEVVRQQMNYLNGELEGEFKVNHSTGYPKIEGSYFEGHETGAWKTYSDKGIIELIIHYEFGKRVKEIRMNGTFEETFPDGRSQSEYTYRNKMKDGPFRVWYDLGEYVIEGFTDAETGEQLQRQVLKGTQVSSEGEYVEGKLDGPVYYYDEKGKLVKTENYRAGELQ